MILVGCSVSGGTGAGLLLDTCRLMAHVASDQLGETPFTIVPLILLPSAFDNVLAPAKRNSASLNAIRALADLGRLIDNQNAPDGEDARVQRYPGGEGGSGTIEVTLPSAAVKTAYLFHRPADVPNDGVLAERVAWFAANLVRQPSVSKVASGPLGSGRVMTLLDRLVNNSGLLQERHPTFIGRRPFASATCVAIRDGREEIIQLVAEDLLREYLKKRRETDTSKVEEWAEAVEEQAGLVPPQKADIEQRLHAAVMNPAVVTEDSLRTAYRNYRNELAKVMPDVGKRPEGGIPDSQSAGADVAFARATGLADATGGWTDVALRAATDTDTDFLDVMLGVRHAAQTWGTGELLTQAPPRAQYPDPSQLVSKVGSRFSRSKTLRPNPATQAIVRQAEASQIDSTWRDYLGNPRGPIVRFRGQAKDLADRLGRVERVLDDWQEMAKETNIAAREASIRERYAYTQNFGALRSGTLRAAAKSLGITDTSAVAVVRAILEASQADVVETWKKSDNLDAQMLPSRLLEPIRNLLARVFDEPDVYVGITQILQRWADEPAGKPDPEVRQFRTKMLASISDSLVPPTLDREIEPMVTVSYPGEQQDGIETKLSRGPDTHSGVRVSSSARHRPPSSPTPPGSAVVVSVSLVGQGLADVRVAQLGLPRRLSKARSDPTPRPARLASARGLSRNHRLHR